MARDPLADPAPLVRRVYAYVAYRIGDGPDAEDVTSDVFERALRYRSSFDGRRGDVLPWLLGIARRCVADAAAARVDHAVSAFPRSGLEAEGLLLLAEIRMKQKRPADARKLCARLLKEHPESPFSIAAKNYLARLGPEEAVGVVRQAESANGAKAAPPAPEAPKP